MNYCATTFKRGTGLGNRLFPWARCIIFSHKHQTPMLMPYWFHIRKGALIKGGIDYSTALKKILIYNNFENYGQYINGLRRLFILTTFRKVNELNQNYSESSNRELYLFSGDSAFFNGLHEYHTLIKTSLEQDLHHSLRKFIANTVVSPIVMNIRRGKDFKDAVVESDFMNKGAIRTPLVWFIETLKQIRSMMNADIPALIISEGDRNDFKDLLTLPNVILSKSPSAITDLILLSKAKIILGSGGSSFTAWGSFLSKASTITIPGQSLQWFNVSNNQDEHIVTTFDPLNPDIELLKDITSKLA